MANIKTTDKKPLHPIQMHIFTVLIKEIKASFGELRPKNVPTDQFTYHLKKLKQMGLITMQDGKYMFTPKGKEFASDVDITSNVKATYAKRGVAIRAIRKTERGYEWLVYQRLKQPYYGFVGFPAGKVFAKESPVETAMREFKEETGLDMLAWRLIKIERNIILKDVNQEESKLNNTKAPLESNLGINVESDFYLYTFDVYEVAGKFDPDPTEGKYMWATLEEIKQMNTFPGMFSSPAHSSWQTMPQRYEEYLKLKEQGKWQNFPERFTGVKNNKQNSGTNNKPNTEPYIISGPVYYEEWYLGNEGW